MPKFEYLIIVDRDGTFYDGDNNAWEINDLGREGWELVSVTTENKLKWSKLFFKRPLYEDQYERGRWPSAQ